MEIKEAIKQIKFPIKKWEIWNMNMHMWERGRRDLYNLSDIYDVLEIKNRETTLIDCHLDYTINDWNKFIEGNNSVELEMIIGTSADILKFKEEWNFYKEDWKFGDKRFLTISFEQYKRRITIYYIDYSRLEK